jgi:YD repeat-containing protein
MTSGKGRTITYGDFNKPTRIDNTQGTTTFTYNSQRKRIQRTTEQDGTETQTFYAGNVEFIYKNGEYSEARRYLPHAIQTHYRGGATKYRYLHKDHLGSIDTITDENGRIVEKLYFDPWGKKSLSTKPSGQTPHKAKLPQR